MSRRGPARRTLAPHASQYNSSITRVRPFFCRLLDQDASGESWLGALLDAVPNFKALPADVREQPGTLHRPRAVNRRVPELGRVISLENCFEYPAPPPKAFLRWLLNNPGQLKWPTKRDGTPKTYGKLAQQLREELVGTDKMRRAAAQTRGLNELSLKGGRGSSGKWWAFEGSTQVDCAFETDRLLLFIEGKRTERISSSTDWYPQRSQLVRNIEAVQDIADDRCAAVLLVTEEPVDGEVNDNIVAASLPHLDSAGRTAVMRRYLGQTTWRDLGALLDVPFETLPETKHEALLELEEQGRVVGPLPARVQRRSSRPSPNREALRPQ